jgi:four helix bundle protein
MLRDFRAYQLAKEHFQLCRRLRLPSFLYEQLLRASSSVVLNLAEGSGKRTPNDQKRFYAIAYGSLLECRAVLELCEKTDSEAMKVNDHLGAMLFKLMSRLSENRKHPTSNTKPQTENRTEGADSQKRTI